MEVPDIIRFSEKSVNFTVKDALWIPSSAKLIAFGSDTKKNGMISLFEICGLEMKSIYNKVYPSSGIMCGTFGISQISERHFASGHEDGHLNIWNIENMRSPFYTVKAHDMIYAIDGIGGTESLDYGPPEVATCGADGVIHIWDTRHNKPVATMVGTPPQECWTVAFGNRTGHSERMVGAGYRNGNLKFFDLRAGKIIWENNLKDGICNVQFDNKTENSKKVIVTCVKSMFHVLEIGRGYDTVSTKIEDEGTVWRGQFFPQNTDLFATSCACSLHIWNYKQGSKRNGVEVSGSVRRLKRSLVSTQPICGFNWCPTKFGLAVATSYDQTISLLTVSKLNKYRIFWKE